MIDYLQRFHICRQEEQMPVVNLRRKTDQPCVSKRVCHSETVNWLGEIQPGEC